MRNREEGRADVQGISLKRRGRSVYGCVQSLSQVQRVGGIRLDRQLEAGHTYKS